MRGPGQYVGTKQSGQNKYIMLALAYPDLYKGICEYCKQICVVQKKYRSFEQTSANMNLSCSTEAIQTQKRELVI